jgi:hypothetical protein
MTLADVGEIFAYWERDPPVHLMVQTIARLLGWTPPNQPSRSAQIDAIAASVPPGLTIMHGGTIGMPEAVFDLEELRTHNQAKAAEIACGTGARPQSLSRTLGSA